MKSALPESMVIFSNGLYVLDNSLEFQKNVNSRLMKDENVYYIVASAKHASKTYSVTLAVLLFFRMSYIPCTPKTCKKNFGKELITSLMSNSNINDLESGGKK